MRDIDACWNWYTDHVMLIDEYERIEKFGTPEEKKKLQGKLKIGVFQDAEKPCFTAQLDAQIAELRIDRDDDEHARQAA